ncbi:MAG: hypothetical protein J4A00_03990, partial [Gammaproteobacteria bacterium]|nr:hypothetical protein [Gammaproteobacteria bacterium]
SGPYQAIFRQIVEGVEGSYSGAVVRLPVSANDPASVASVSRAMARNPDSVIALGQTALDLLEPIHGDVPLVTGAVLAPPSTDSGLAAGISLAPDPDVLFRHLSNMVPAVTEVHVVVDRARLAWLISHAEVVAAKYKMTLRVHDVGDLVSAAKKYRELLASMESMAGAIWLLTDSGALDNKNVLPLVLRKAWDRNLVVFSSSLAHVNRGALFAFYPDHYAMGASLVSLTRLQQQSPGQPVSGLLPLKDLRLAVNSRTASHLGLRVDLEAVARDGLVFPWQR